MSEAPAIRSRVAGSHVDVGDSVVRARKVPCICPAQHDDAVACTVDYSTCRRILVERVRCARCWRTWTRVNP